MAPLASVVVSCYNYGHYVGECLDSIFRQTLADLEVIVVNDASTDHTAEVLRRIRDPRLITLTHEKNLGVAQAMTTGLRAARGAFVAHVDADDRYRPEFLAETVTVLQQRPDVGLVYADIASMDPDGRVLEDPWRGMRTREVHGGRDTVADEFLLNLEDNVIPAAAVIARREAWLDALPFPAWFTYESVWDWYLHLRIARTYLVAYRARTLSDYRLHPNNMHQRPVRDRSAETTIISVLDEMLEGDDRAAEKRRLRRRLYGRAYWMAAKRYFQANMNSDARRCFLTTLRYRPDYVLRPASLRQLAATFIDRGTYEQVKRILKRAA